MARSLAEIKADLRTHMSMSNDELIEDSAQHIYDKEQIFETLSEEVKELKAKAGRSGFSSAPQTKGLRAELQAGISRGINECKAEIKTLTGSGHMKPYEFKAVGVINSSNLTVDNFISYLDWRPGMEPTGQFHFRNLVRTVLSDTDFVQYPRANTPVGEGSFARVPEGSNKPQVDRDYTMQTLTLLPMAAYAICSRQSLRNIVFLQSWLPESLLNQMEDQEDTDFANQLVTAATGSTATSKTVLPEKLISYMKNLIVAKYNPTAIVVSPDVWEDLLTFKPGTESYSLPGPVTLDSSGTIKLLNRPVYPVNWLSGRRVIIGDWSKAAIAQSESLTLRTSESHSSIFIANQIAFLMERVEGLVVYRPDAFISTTV